MRVRRGVALELTDLHGGGNVGMIFYNPENLLERLNLPDTLKCQHTFRVTEGHCLYSDMGRIFCSVIEDDCGWHDAACGTCNADIVQARWGASDYQSSRNDYLRNGRDAFLIELGKYGMGKRDLTGNMNWFSRVLVDEAGLLRLDGPYAPGSRIVLRFEMDTLVVLHTCPHPLNEVQPYPRCDIGYRLFPVPPPGPEDACRLSRAENGRGFENNDIYHLGA
jgi:urea carboxylase-associated protein 2